MSPAGLPPVGEENPYISGAEKPLRWGLIGDVTYFLAEFANGAIGSIEASRVSDWPSMGSLLHADWLEGRDPLRPTTHVQARGFAGFGSARDSRFPDD